MTRYMDAAQELLECYRDALQAPGFPDPIPDEKICLRHGEFVAPSLGTQEDECCTGLAWVRIVNVEPLRDPVGLPQGCVTSERRVELEMGGVHCLPWGTVEAPPTCAQWTDVALRADAFHDAMEKALCCFAAVADAQNLAESVTAGIYEPSGPDGNCIGGTMRVFVETSCSSCVEGT